MALRIVEGMSQRVEQPDADDTAIEARVLAALEALGVPYEEVRIDPALAATADFCAHYGYDPEDSGNCIVVAGKTGEPRHAACVVQATRRLDVNRVVRRKLGVRKASFADAELTEALTGMRTGGVTPFGLPEGLPVLIDPLLMERERVVVGGGSRSLKLLVPPGGLQRIPGAELVEGLSGPG